MTPNAVQKKIPLLDLRAQHQPLREEILTAIARVVDSQAFIMGEEVKLLEREVAAYCGVPYAIGCASGSDALFLALLAAGVEPGDSVITTPFTFFATAGAIVRAGGRPVFVDIDPVTFNLNPTLVIRAIESHESVRAILPVHLFGGCADMDPIREAARTAGCAVIEDGAQAIGAQYKGRPAMSIGEIGCISFFPSKNLGGMGDGGMVTTHDEILAKKLGALRLHGATKKYYHEWIGINSRLDTMQAAVLRIKLQHLDEETEGRGGNARRYHQLLSASPVPVVTPSPAPYQSRYVWNQYVIRCQSSGAGLTRDGLRLFLQERGIGTEIYYPLPLHLQACFEYLGYKEGDFPVSEQAAKEVLALPVYGKLAADDIEWICQSIRDFYC